MQPYGLLGSSVHGILQVRILEWVAMLPSRGSSRPRDQTRLLCLLHWQESSLPLAPPGKLILVSYRLSILTQLIWAILLLSLELISEAALSSAGFMVPDKLPAMADG